ncbi:MAG: PQ-loop repeat-containing protein [Blastocatellia bacterium]|nr:PQ-loop repeat-containing protein [Blastocatellia bacterium]
MEIIGWTGTALVIIAYYPQIQHLFVQKCAWGISIWTWVIWLGSSTLLLIYSLVRNDMMFVIVQIINMLAIAATLFWPDAAILFVPIIYRLLRNLPNNKEILCVTTADVRCLITIWAIRKI